MGRVLLLTVRPPFPAHDGFRIVTWNLSRCLADNGYELDLLCFRAAEATTSDQRQVLGEVFARVEIAPRPADERNWGTAFKALLSGGSYFVAKHTDAAFRRQLGTLLAERSYEAVLIDSTFMAANLGAIREASGFDGRVLVRAHNVEHEIFARLAARATRPAERWVYRREALAVRRFERETLSRSDGVRPISDRDGETLRRLGVTAPITLLPAMIDADHYRPDETRPVRPESVVLISNLGYPPNVNGALWFLDEVWPRVVETHPNARFQLVGRDPPRRLLQRAGQTVEITGFVEDERPHIATACVYAVPLWEGSGVRLKILTAMAMGRPVLSTSIGAEGIDWQGLTIEDTAEGWVRALDRAFSGDCGLDAGAADHVRRHYHWQQPLEL